MKTKPALQFVKRAALFLLLSTLNPSLFTWAQGTAFTYQGQLKLSGSPVNGSYDLAFALYDAGTNGTLISGPLTNSATLVSNGLFTTTLDFGANFPGLDRWLQIGVRTNGNGAFATLSPLQHITPTPYAITAEYLASVIELNSVGPFYATVAGGEGNTASGAWSAVGGGDSNKSTDQYATVGGGLLNSSLSEYATVGGGYFNSSTNLAATVAGGYLNSASGSYSTVGGGAQNSASGNGAVVAGGGINGTTRQGNFATGISSTVSGGSGNSAYGNYSTICGGANNSCSGFAATACGGDLNTAIGSYSFAAGNGAQALHDGSFVWADDAGLTFSSTANNQFLIRAAGGVGIGTASPQTQLHVQGANGAQLRLQETSTGDYYNIYTESSGNLLFVPSSGPFSYLRHTDGAWLSGSDARLKQDITAMGGVLPRVLQLRPVAYHFRNDAKKNSRSLGLIAQEVEPLFPEVVGEHDGMKALAYSELVPVAIGAIQELNEKVLSEAASLRAENAGLNHKLDEKDADVQQLIQQNKSLASRLSELEQLVKSLAAKN